VNALVVMVWWWLFHWRSDRITSVCIIDDHDHDDSDDADTIITMKGC